jgi:hypothetical protein
MAIPAGAVSVVTAADHGAGDAADHRSRRPSYEGARAGADGRAGDRTCHGCGRGANKYRRRKGGEDELIHLNLYLPVERVWLWTGKRPTQAKVRLAAIRGRRVRT